MPLDDFYAFMVMDSMEPFGERRGDLQAAQIAHILAVIHRKPNSTPQRLSDFLEDFTPRWLGEEHEIVQTPEQQLQTFMAIRDMQNLIESKKMGHA